MEKAYDFGVLADRLKEKGMDVAEEAAKIAVGEMLTWLVDSAKLSENVYDDVLIAVIPLFEQTIGEQLDKIDGEVDGPTTTIA